MRGMEGIGTGITSTRSQEVRVYSLQFTLGDNICTLPRGSSLQFTFTLRDNFCTLPRGSSLQFTFTLRFSEKHTTYTQAMFCTASTESASVNSKSPSLRFSAKT